MSRCTNLQRKKKFNLSVTFSLSENDKNGSVSVKRATCKVWIMSKRYFYLQMRGHVSQLRDKTKFLLHKIPSYLQLVSWIFSSITSSGFWVKVHGSVKKKTIQTVIPKVERKRLWNFKKFAYFYALHESLVTNFYARSWKAFSDFSKHSTRHFLL